MLAAAHRGGGPGPDGCPSTRTRSSWSTACCPGIDGATVVRRLKSDAALRNTPCLLLTGFGGRRDELRALEAGADAYARKSEDLGLILARLGGAAAQRRARAVATAARACSGPKRLLAVDDSATYLRRARRRAPQRRLRRGAGASPARRRWTSWPSQPVDCILLDLLMPGIVGPGDLSPHQERPRCADIPLIMLTARDDRDAIIGASTRAPTTTSPSRATSTCSRPASARSCGASIRGREPPNPRAARARETSASNGSCTPTSSGSVLGDVGGMLRDAGDERLLAKLVGYSRAELECGALRWSQLSSQ